MILSAMTRLGYPFMNSAPSRLDRKNIYNHAMPVNLSFGSTAPTYYKERGYGGKPAVPGGYVAVSGAYTGVYVGKARRMRSVERSILSIKKNSEIFFWSLLST